MENIRDLVIKTRSYRRFDNKYTVGKSVLEELIDLARLSASGANRQPIKYLIYNTPGDCERVFPSIAWAAYLKEWDGPGPEERPTAYIIMLGDKSITESFGIDHGIAAQSIMLGATEKGLGGCMIASIRKDYLRGELKIPEVYEILLILALGRPVENVIIDTVSNGDIKYWRDGERNHHVPKRSLDELIISL